MKKESDYALRVSVRSGPGHPSDSVGRPLTCVWAASCHLSLLPSGRCSLLTTCRLPPPAEKAALPILYLQHRGGADEVATEWLSEFPHSDWEIAVFSFFLHYLWSCGAVTYPAPRQGGRRCADVMLSHWRLRFPAPAELGLALLSGMEGKHQRGGEKTCMKTGQCAFYCQRDVIIAFVWQEY